jgi:hypothetical protein
LAVRTELGGKRGGDVKFEEHEVFVSREAGAARAPDHVGPSRPARRVCPQHHRPGRRTGKGGIRPGCAHPTDRRATIIELTDRGRAAHRGVYAAHADRAAALFATLTPTDRRHLTRILTRLADALAATSAAEGTPVDLDPAAFRIDPSPAKT